MPAKHLPSPKKHTSSEKRGVGFGVRGGRSVYEGLKREAMSGGLVLGRPDAGCVHARACACLRTRLFISSVQMGGRVALAAK